jgi:hypothetical protein
MHTPEAVYERCGYVQRVVKMKVYLEGDVTWRRALIVPVIQGSS